MKKNLAYVNSLIGLVLSFSATCGDVGNWLQPSFLASMNSWQTYLQFDDKAALKDAYTPIAIKCYNDFWANGVQYHAEPLIPKIIHQIWLGSPLPEKYKQFQQSWKKYHPDWTYILWTEKEIEEFGLKNKKIYDASTNYGQKSDIARYEILYRIGGLYVDTDFECLKPFDILHHCLDFYTSCLPENKETRHLSLLNGLVAACPAHPILKSCVEGIEESFYSNKEIMAQTGPYFLTKVVFSNLTHDCGRSVIFPASFFYPLPNYFAWHYINQEDAKKQFIRDESFAIHWWACSWQKRSSSLGSIEVICTAAILNQDNVKREKEYAEGINRVRQFGYMPFIVESCKSGSTFLDTLSERVWYAQTNDYSLKNKGINEAKALLHFFEHNHFDDEDLIIKVTGRYYFIDDYFLQYIAQHCDEYDAFVKDVAKMWGHNFLDIFTACFAMKYKYLIEFLRQLNFEEMEKKMICIEWKLGEYIASKKEMRVCMMDKLNLRYRISYDNKDKYI